MQLQPLGAELLPLWDGVPALPLAWPLGFTPAPLEGAEAAGELAAGGVGATGAGVGLTCFGVTGAGACGWGEDGAEAELNTPPTYRPTPSSTTTITAAIVSAISSGRSVPPEEELTASRCGPPGQAALHRVGLAGPLSRAGAGGSTLGRPSERQSNRADEFRRWCRSASARRSAARRTGTSARPCLPSLTQPSAELPGHIAGIEVDRAGVAVTGLTAVAIGLETAIQP